MTQPYREAPKTEWFFTWETGGVVTPPKGPGWELHSWQTPAQDMRVRGKHPPESGVRDIVVALVLWRRDT